MRFLANENFPLPSIKLIREAGYEVKSISQDTPGISDEEVLEQAVREKLIILTFDRDYGELIFKYKRKTPPAIIYFRTKGTSPKSAGETFLHIICDNTLSLYGFFTVIEDTGIRQRKI